MSTKPSDAGRFAVDGSDVNAVNISAPSGSLRNTGFPNDYVPPAGEFNYLENIHYRWQQWLNDGNCAFANLSATGTLSAAGATTLSSTLAAGASTLASAVVTGLMSAGSASVAGTMSITGNTTVVNLTVSGTFVHTGAEFLPLGPGMAALGALPNITYAPGDDRLLKLSDTGTIEVGYPIPLGRGRRIIGVRVHVLHTSATAGLWQARLYSSDMSNVTTPRSTQVSSTATASKQVIVLTGITPTAIAADQSWFVYLTSPGGVLCDRYSFGVEIQHDA